jgi:hypothetical protein
MGRASRLKQERRTSLPSDALLPSSSGALRRAGQGAITGLCIALFAVAVGVVRIFIAVQSGRGVSFDDLHILFFYVGGFVLAGSAVALLWPWAKTRMSRYALGMLGAALMLGLFLVGIYGSPQAWSHVPWATWITLSALFGVVAGRTFATWEQPRVTVHAVRKTRGQR